MNAVATPCGQERAVVGVETLSVNATTPFPFASLSNAISKALWWWSCIEGKRRPTRWRLVRTASFGLRPLDGTGRRKTLYVRSN